MPTYVYQPASSQAPKQTCEACAGGFEMVQKMSEDALTKCPQCGHPVERVIMAPNVNGAGKFSTPSDGRMSRAGFTQYKRKGKGYYEKSFGQGPSALHGDSE